MIGRDHVLFCCLFEPIFFTSASYLEKHAAPALTQMATTSTPLTKGAATSISCEPVVSTVTEESDTPVYDIES